MSRDNPETTRQAGGTQEKNTRLIAWNGVQLNVPKDWEARVSEQHHLVFEKAFRPLLQIRWEQSVHHPSRNLQKRVQHWATELGAVIVEDILPLDLQPMAAHFGQVTCYRKKNGMMQGGICLCAESHRLILFHILTSDQVLVKEVRGCLATLSCSSHAENLWCIQDFSLRIPARYTLQDYTFAAGLTRLSFVDSDVLLQICTLGPADIRLIQQSLQQILIALTGVPQLDIDTGRSGNSCTGRRCPTITQQIFFRFRREKPFIRAAIRHDTGNNRLLAIVLSANHPIDPTTLQQISQEYEIIQK